ncbi:MAG: hypothetical protein HGB05_11030 [Chloroflexi bacterium]|nr:hypothetical protein [Chloroflexota bacterium]
MKKLLTSLALLLPAVSSWAAVTLYTSEASYLAAVGATRIYVDFAGTPAATVSGASFSSGMTFGSCTDSNVPGTCGTSVFHNSDAITDLGGSVANNGVASLAWRFILPDVFAFGFNYVSGDIAGIQLVDPSLTMIFVDTATASDFIGLVSDVAFYGGIAVNAVSANGDNDRYFIDDFRISELRVPEPGSLPLLMAALAIAYLVGFKSGKPNLQGRPRL